MTSLLTIAIPTYNRSAYLDLCLDRINADLMSLSVTYRCLVEIYIANNCSTDNTCNVIKKHKNIFSVCDVVFNDVVNDGNIGADRNIMQCYQYALTPYVWILGDDDVVLSGGLKLILDVLMAQKVDIVFMNGYGYTDSYLDDPSIGNGLSGLTSYTSSYKFVQRFHIMLTSITALIVRAGVNVSALSNIVKDSNLSQLSWVLTLLRDGNNFTAIESKVFAAKLDNSGGYHAIDVFGRKLSYVVDSILHDSSVLANVIKNASIVMWFPSYIMNVRIGKSLYLNENIIIEMNQVFGGNWRYHLFLVPLIRLPIQFARIYFNFVRVVRRFLNFAVL